MELERFFGSQEQKEAVTSTYFYDRAAKIYHAWHNAEGGENIIDYNLTGPAREEDLLTQQFVRAIPRRRTVEEVVDALLEEMDSFKPPREERHNFNYLKAQLGASRMYLEKLLGREITQKEYVEATMQVAFEKIPKNVLDGWRDEIHDRAGDLGMELSEKGMRSWKEEHRLTEEQAQWSLKKHGIEAAKRLGSFLGERIEFPFTVEPVSENKYWFVWADTDPRTGGFRYKQNFYSGPERQKIWTTGKTEELGPHEIAAHGGRMFKRSQLIQKNRLHRVFGYTMVHGPEAVIDEGLGLTITKFVPGHYESLSEEGRFQIDASIYRQMVYGNVSFMLTMENATQKQTKEYVKHYLPWESDAEIAQEQRDRTEDPLLSTYRIAYQQGAKLFLYYSANLSNEGKREFLKRIFSRPYTPKQVDWMFRKLLEERRFRGGSMENILKYPPETLPGGNAFVS